jgi:hypothetical protein
VGNRWLYHYERPLSNITDTIKIEVEGSLDLTYDGEQFTGYILDDRPIHAPELPYKWMYTNGDSGVYIGGGVAATDTFAFKDLVFKYPASVGDRWEHRRIAYSWSNEIFYPTDTITFSLIATDEELETPAGIFSCYVYQFTQKIPEDDVLCRLWDYKYYFAPGVGMVGYFAIDQCGYVVKDKLLLMEYHLYIWR